MSNKASLLYSLRDELLEKLGSLAGKPCEGISQAARFCKRQGVLGAPWCNKIVLIDFAYNFVRHLDTAHYDKFLNDLSAELAGHGAAQAAEHLAQEAVATGGSEVDPVAKKTVSFLETDDSWDEPSACAKSLAELDSYCASFRERARQQRELLAKVETTLKKYKDVPGYASELQELEAQIQTLRQGCMDADRDRLSLEEQRAQLLRPHEEHGSKAVSDLASASHGFKLATIGARGMAGASSKPPRPHGSSSSRASGGSSHSRRRGLSKNSQGRYQPT